MHLKPAPSASKQMTLYITFLTFVRACIQARSSRDSNTSAASLTLPAPPQSRPGPASQAAAQHMSAPTAQHRPVPAARQRHATSASHSCQPGRCSASTARALEATLSSASADRHKVGAPAQQAKARSCRPPPPPPPLPAQVSRPDPSARAAVVKRSAQTVHENGKPASTQGDHGCLRLGVQLDLLPRCAYRQGTYCCGVFPSCHGSGLCGGFQRTRGFLQICRACSQS
jgi:hypothetical protein